MGELYAERVTKLELMSGWYWSAYHTWDDNYQVLQSFVEENGHIPKWKATHNDIKIGYWCAAQRKSHKRGKLAANRIAKLDAVPGWFRTK